MLSYQAQVANIKNRSKIQANFMRISLFPLHASIQAGYADKMKQSAGTLLFRTGEGGLEVLLVHASGSYNRKYP